MLLELFIFEFDFEFDFEFETHIKPQLTKKTIHLKELNISHMRDVI